MIEESEGLSFSRLNPRRGNDARKAANFKKARGFMWICGYSSLNFPYLKEGFDGCFDPKVACVRGEVYLQMFRVCCSGRVSARRMK